MKPIRLFASGEEIEADILKKLNKSKESVQQSVNEIRQWIQMQAHLPEIMDDFSIRNFIIYNKFNMESTRKKIDLHYSVRSKLPILFQNINPRLPHMRRIFDAVYFVPLPKLTEDKSTVYIYKVKNFDLSYEMIQQHFSGHIINLMEIQLKESVDVNKTFIIDTTDVTSECMRNFNPSIMAKMLTIYKEIYHFPVKAIYIINPRQFVHTMLAFCKLFMKPKVYQRIHFCKNEELLQFLPKDIVPVDYGGLEKSLEEINNDLKLKLIEYEKRFDQLDQLKVDETLRTDKLVISDNIFGCYGSFKTLEFD